MKKNKAPKNALLLSWKKVILIDNMKEIQVMENYNSLIIIKKITANYYGRSKKLVNNWHNAYYEKYISNWNIFIYIKYKPEKIMRWHSKEMQYKKV